MEKIQHNCLDLPILISTGAAAGFALYFGYGLLLVLVVIAVLAAFVGLRFQVTTDISDFMPTGDDRVRARIADFQTDTGHLYNLEATPAEGTTYRFAREDRKRWPDIRQAGSATQPYYTNSSQLPAGFTDDPVEDASFALRPGLLQEAPKLPGARILDGRFELSISRQNDAT